MHPIRSRSANRLDKYVHSRFLTRLIPSIECSIRFILLRSITLWPRSLLFFFLLLCSMPSIPRIDFLDTTVDDFFKTRNNENASSRFRTLPYERRRTLQLSFEINCSRTIIRLGYLKKKKKKTRYWSMLHAREKNKIHTLVKIAWIFCIILDILHDTSISFWWDYYGINYNVSIRLINLPNKTSSPRISY